MKLLIDSHVVIWFISEKNKVPKNVLELIRNSDNTCYVSIATLWELSIKYSLGRLYLNISLSALFSIIQESGFLILPIDSKHIITNSSLPFHHYDPFDRIIISQAISEQFQLISKDKKFKEYLPNIIWK